MHDGNGNGVPLFVLCCVGQSSPLSEQQLDELLSHPTLYHIRRAIFVLADSYFTFHMRLWVGVLTQFAQLCKVATWHLCEMLNATGTVSKHVDGGP